MLAPSLLHLPTLKPNPSVNANFEVLYYESLAMSVMRLADLQEQREFHVLDQSNWIERTYLFSICYHADSLFAVATERGIV